MRITNKLVIKLLLIIKLPAFFAFCIHVLNSFCNRVSRILEECLQIGISAYMNDTNGILVTVTPTPELK